jgi:hypothetical protein
MPRYLSFPVSGFLCLPLLIVAALPVLLVGLAIRLRKLAFQPELIPFWCCGIALWLSELQRPDVQHLIWASPILLILVSTLWRRISPHRGVALLCSASLLAFSSIYILTAHAAQMPIETRRGQLFGQAQDKALDFLQKNTHPGDDVFVYPYFPQYYFLSDTRNPTRLSYYIYGWNPPEQFQAAVAQLEAKRVRYVLWDVETDLHFLLPRYQAPPANEQPIERYLESHYHQLSFANGFRIMERNY